MSWNQCTEGSCRLEICSNSLEHLTFSSYPKMTFERPHDLNKAITISGAVTSRLPGSDYKGLLELSDLLLSITVAVSTYWSQHHAGCLRYMSVRTKTCVLGFVRTHIDVTWKWRHSQGPEPIMVTIKLTLPCWSSCLAKLLLTETNCLIGSPREFRTKPVSNSPWRAFFHRPWCLFAEAFTKGSG